MHGDLATSWQSILCPSSALAIMLVDDPIGRGPHVIEMCLAWSHLAPRFRVGLTGFITTITQSHGDPLQATRGEASGLSYRAELQSHLECG
jgi:hypothetical protein